MISLKDIRVSLHEVSDKLGVGRCERCNGTNAQIYPAMTAYSTAGLNLEIDDDPNAPVFLCSCCHNEYVDHWTEMWNEYRAGQY